MRCQHKKYWFNEGSGIRSAPRLTKSGARITKALHVKIHVSYWAFSNLASDWLTAEPLANQKATLENHRWLTRNLTWIFLIIQVPDSPSLVTDTSFEAWTGSSLVQVMASLEWHHVSSRRLNPIVRSTALLKPRPPRATNAESVEAFPSQWWHHHLYLFDASHY